MNEVSLSAPSRTQGKRRLSAELVLTTAVNLLDEEGLATFSLRRLATRLGVHVTSLYQYFPTRDDLFSAVFHFIHDTLEHEDNDTVSWQQHLGTSMRSYRQLLLRHPYLPLLSPYATGAAVAHIEVELAALARAGFSPEEAARAFRSLWIFVVGSAVSDLNKTIGSPLDRAPPENRQAYPHTVAAASYLGDKDANFEFGLEALMRAIADMHAEAGQN